MVRGGSRQNFRGGGFSSHYTTKTEMLHNDSYESDQGLGPVLQIAEDGPLTCLTKCPII